MLQIFQAENYERLGIINGPLLSSKRLVSVSISPEIVLAIIIRGTSLLSSSPVVAIMAQEITKLL